MQLRNCFEEAISSKRQVKRKLGHVVQTYVVVCGERDSKSLYSLHFERVSFREIYELLVRTNETVRYLRVSWSR